MVINRVQRSVATIEASDLIRVYGLLIILTIGVIMLCLAWVGYVGSDDHSYARGALGWFGHFPYVGDDHWSLRHTVTIPLAASLAVFGMREVSLGIPSAFLYLAFIALNYWYLQRFFDYSFAFFVSILLASVPLFAVQATFPQTTIPETLAVSASFWFFYSATCRKKTVPLLVCSGVAAAFGFLTRETTLALLLFYAIVFSLGISLPRRKYWILAATFCLVIGVEVLYFTVLTGDPIYRYRIDFFHDAVDRVRESNAARASGSSMNIEGNLAVSAVFEPVVALLLNQEFGLLFWVFVPAAIWTLRGKSMLAEHKSCLRLLITLGLVWMAFVSLGGSKLYVSPRYYAVSTWVAVIIVAYWLRWFLYLNWPRIAKFAVGGLIAVNFLCIYLENKNPLFAERTLINYVSRHEDIVYTDPMTMNRAKLLLEFAGTADRVRVGPVPDDSLFYFNRNNIERCKRSYECNWQVTQYLPQDGWLELTRIESKQKLSGVILVALGIDKFLPEDILERFNKPNKPAVLYRTGSHFRAGSN